MAKGNVMCYTSAVFRWFLKTISLLFVLNASMFYQTPLQGPDSEIQTRRDVTSLRNSADLFRRYLWPSTPYLLFPA